MSQVNRTSVAYACAAAAAGAAAVSLWSYRRRKRQRTRLSIAEGYTGLIGNTPMVRLHSLSDATGCDIFAKVEFLNPGGTGKDRLAAAMIEAAEAAGLLKPGGTVVEGTSGSTGISLASICRARGFRCVIVMPDDQAGEKKAMLETLGATVVQVKTAAIASPEHYVNAARRIAAETLGAVFMDQFETSANFNVHYARTAPEIWSQTGGALDAFVMGAGTGGSIAGVSAYLKERRRGIRVYLVDPPGSSLFNRVKFGVCYAAQQAERAVRRHRYDTLAEGIGLDRVTANFAKATIDDAFAISDQEAVTMAHYLLRHEGLLLGSSSAMNAAGAVKAARQLGSGHTIVTVLCDHGARYASRFWNRAFVEGRGLQWPEPDQLLSLDFVT
ncbi:putative cysteine synthase [Tribonema minus]|uniref:Putative cysteine synthase n=1 Tax=Tribonema minus TaxID=303371 RepID=A0A835Z4W8_9STRA|nr:putative cysteine synthase [Tribonema minus]